MSAPADEPLDLEAVVSAATAALVYGLTVTARYQVKDVAAKAAETAFRRWHALAPAARGDLFHYCRRAAKWRAMDLMRRLTYPLYEPPPSPTPEDILLAEEEELSEPAAPPGRPVPPPGLLSREEERLLRLHARMPLARAAGKMKLSETTARRLETSALRKLGHTVNTVSKLRKKSAPLPVWSKADRESTRTQSGRVLRLADMSPEKQAEMRRLYETEPNRKRAAGQCPEAGCSEPRYSALTGRCLRCHARWPGAGQRRRLDLLLAKLAADAAAANQPVEEAA